MKTEDFYKLYLEEAFAPTVPSVRAFCGQLVRVTRQAFKAKLVSLWWNNDLGKALTFETSDPKRPILFENRTISASDSLTGRAIQTVDIAFTPSIAKASPRSPANPEVHVALGLQSLLSVPIPNPYNNQEIVGVLNVSFGIDVAFQLDDHRERIAWLQFMCSQFIELLVLATRQRISGQVAAFAANATDHYDLLRGVLSEMLRQTGSAEIRVYSMQPEGGIRLDCTVSERSGFKVAPKHTTARGTDNLIERAKLEGTAVLGHIEITEANRNAGHHSHGFQRIVCPLPVGNWAEPVLPRAEMQGFIECLRKPTSRPASFSKLDMDAIQALSQALGPAIVTHETRAAARARREALVDFMNTIASCVNETEVFSEVAKAIRLSGFPRAMLSSLHTSEGVIRGAAVTSPELTPLKKATVRKYPGPDVLPQVLESMEDRFIPDSRIEEGLCDRPLAERFDITSQHVYPIHVHGDRIGTLQVFPADYRKLGDQDELVIQSVCQLTAVAISRLRYAEKANSALDTSEQELRLDNIYVTCYSILHDTLKQLRQVSEGLTKLASSLPPNISLDLEERQKEIQAHRVNLRTLASIHVASAKRAGAEGSRRAHNLGATIDRWVRNVGHNRAAVGRCHISPAVSHGEFKTVIPSHTLELVLANCLHNALQVHASYFKIVIGANRPEKIKLPADDCICVSIENDIHKTSRIQRRYNLRSGIETCRRVLDLRGGGFDIDMDQPKRATAYLLIPVKDGNIS